jgi:RNA polymerase sigma-70 factor (ECF subfamily)
MDAQALKTMFEDARSLRRLASCLVAPGAADDLVQDTMIVAARVDAPPSSRPWLRGVMRNLARMQHREAARRRIREDAADLARDQASPDEQLHRMRVQRALCDAVLELPEAYRQVIVLHHFDGLALAEIARRESVPEGTIRWRHKEALDRLRGALDRQNGGDRNAWVAALAPLAKLKAPGGPLELEPRAGKPTAGIVAAKIAAAVLVLGAVATVAVITLRGDHDVPPRGDSTTSLQVAPPRHAAPSAPPAPRLGSDEDLSNSRDRVKVGAGPLPAVPARYELTRINDTSVAVALGGGKSDVWVPANAPRGPIGEHTIAGRVVDAHGAPVAGAVVVVADRLQINWGQMLGNAGATTDADGRYTVEHAPAGAMIVLHPSGWSAVVAVADHVDLTIAPNGGIAGRVRYGKQPIESQLAISPHGFDRVVFRLDSAPDGHFRVPMLAPGDYEVIATPARGIAGGSSKRNPVTVHIAGGTITTQDIELAEGVLLVVHGVPPAGRIPTIVDAFLIAGHHPIADHAALSALIKQLPPDAHDELLFGGEDAATALQFHDRTPGPYTACAETTFDGGKSFGCMTLDLAAVPNAREIEIVTH